MRKRGQMRHDKAKPVACHWVRFLAVLFIVPAAGCPRSSGRRFDLASAHNLRVGETTMAEVRSLFGNPYAEIDAAIWKGGVMHFGDDDTRKMWYYRYGTPSVPVVAASGAGGHLWSLEVDLDSDGRVTDYWCSNNCDWPYFARAIRGQGTDFDILWVKENLLPQKATKLEVLSYLGDAYRVMSINKPGVQERWHYGYIGFEKASLAGTAVDRCYQKSVDIDFDVDGVVVSVRGQSNFSEDKKRFFKR